jgi:hypothetical protein
MFIFAQDVEGKQKLEEYGELILLNVLNAEHIWNSIMDGRKR